MKSYFPRLGTVALTGLAITCSASAVVISTPLSLSTEFLVGTGTFVTGDGSSESTELGIAQTILNLNLGEISDSGDGHVYKANTVFSYSGTLSDANQDNSGGTSIGAGFAYALAKYDGPNAGYILYYLGGTATTLPNLPADIWGNSQDTGLALSHFTTFSSTTSEDPPPRVPDGGSTVVLLGGALVVLAGLKRVSLLSV